MRIAKIDFTARFSLASAALNMLLLHQSCFASAADDYNKAMKAFNSRDFKTADTYFNQVIRAGSEQSPSATYMDALSNQYLNNMPKATLLFKQACDRFPDSAACVRSQTALARLDPAYLKRWKISHPVAEDHEFHSIDVAAIANVNVAPNFTFGTRQVTADEAKTMRARLHSGEPIIATVSSIPTSIQLINAPGCFIGLNQLNDAGVKNSAKAGNIYTCEVVIAGVKISNFPFRVKQHLTGPVQVGKDFADTFDYRMSMSDPDYQRRWQYAVAQHKKAESVVNRAVSDTSADGKGGGAAGPGALTPESFDISYQIDGRKNIFVMVYVDNSAMQMIYGQAGVTTMSPDQLRSISGEYVPPDNELTSETLIPGLSVRSSASVTVRSIRLGKIDKRDAPVKIEAFSSPRYQAPISVNTNAPRLGSDVYADWQVRNDEDHHVLKFSRGSAPPAK